eukprot:s5236_g2.t1
MARRSASRRLLILPCVLIWFFHFEATFSIPEGIQQAARAQRISPENFLENVNGNAGAYQKSNKIAGRVDFMKSLKQAAMELSDLGGFVAEGKRRWNTKNVPRWLSDVSTILRAMSAALARADFKKDEVVEGGVAQVFSILLNIKAPEDFVKAFVAAAVAGGQVPVIMIDEANLAFPTNVAGGQVPVIMIDEANLAFPTNGENGGANAAKREAASKALNTFVALTKEKREASVILIASDYAFPLGLEGLGLYKYDSLKSIVFPEVEEEPMLEAACPRKGLRVAELLVIGANRDVLQEFYENFGPSLHLLAQAACPRKGLRVAELLVIGANRDVLQEFYENFGGNVFLCHQAIDKLLQQFRMSEESLFDPFRVRGRDGLDGLVRDELTHGLVRDELTRQHIENLAEKGWSPIEGGTATEETESQNGARVIAKRNFGAIINEETTTFLDQALKEEMFRDPNVVRVLLPPTTYARRCMQRMVETMKSSRPRQAGADGNGGFQLVGNAFPIDPAYLKKALTSSRVSLLLSACLQKGDDKE